MMHLDFWPIGAVALLAAAGWLALLFAPLRYRFAWVLARSCALAIAAIGLIDGLLQTPLSFTMMSWPLNAGLLGSGAGQAAAQLAWSQLMCLTLFVGSWMVEDAPRHAIPHGIVAPLLMVTALTGPLGLLCFMLIRDGFKLRQARAVNGPGS